MAKRKRVETATNGPTPSEVAAPTKKTKPSTSKPELEPSPKTPAEQFSIQIVAGSYDRVLHGIIATVSPQKGVEFADTFLFNAHPSAIRCVAVSPPSNPIPGQEQKVLLASGSTDPRINIYSLSAHPPKRRDKDEMSSVALRPILENTKNRELGAYNPHDSTVTKLAFPTRSKLISSSEDSTIAVAKTRNWEPMSTIKAPIPKPQGRPSGDTAPPGGLPAGVNDFAVHPSMKLLISVSKGERCMRLWNLLTGKKAAVLNFGKDMLQEVGEGRHSTGEGRKVVWGATSDSEEFAVGFDRDIVVFGMDSLPKCRVMPNTRTKVHHFEYILVDEKTELALLAVATEDGRIMFFSTETKDLSKPASDAPNGHKLQVSKLVAQIGGKEAGVSGRIKDFNVIKREEQERSVFYFATGSSDGTVRLWRLPARDLVSATTSEKENNVSKTGNAKQVGSLLGAYNTNNRITCTGAFVMIPRPDGVEESGGESDGEAPGADSDFESEDGDDENQE